MFLVILTPGYYLGNAIDCTFCLAQCFKLGNINLYVVENDIHLTELNFLLSIIHENYSYLIFHSHA